MPQQGTGIDRTQPQLVGFPSFSTGTIGGGMKRGKEGRVDARVALWCGGQGVEALQISSSFWRTLFLILWRLWGAAWTAGCWRGV